MFIRLRMPLTFQFILREPPARAGLLANDRYIKLRLTVNGKRDAGFSARPRHIHPSDGSISFGDMLVVDKTKWNPAINQLKGRDQQTLDINNTIDRIRLELKDICARQQQRFDKDDSPRPTVDSVKYEYQTGQIPAVIGGEFVYPPEFLARKAKKSDSKRMPAHLQASHPGEKLSANMPLLDVYTAFLVEWQLMNLHTGKRSKGTYMRRKVAYDYLSQYGPAVGLPARSITPYWLERFHVWLLTQPSGNPDHKFLDRRMKPATASSYCSCLTECMDWLRAQYVLRRC